MRKQENGTVTKSPRKLAEEKRQRSTRRLDLGNAILNTWGSLHTHLAGAVNTDPKKRAQENEEWNARCVREYAETIRTLSVELHELTKIDFPDAFYPEDRSPLKPALS